MRSNVCALAAIRRSRVSPSETDVTLPCSSGPAAGRTSNGTNWSHTVEHQKSSRSSAGSDAVSIVDVGRAGSYHGPSFLRKAEAGSAFRGMRTAVTGSRFGT